MTDPAHVEVPEGAGELQAARHRELGEQQVQLVHLEEPGLDLRHNSLQKVRQNSSVPYPDVNPDPPDPLVFGLPDPDQLVRGMEPDSDTSITKQK
jgi:hypothetical protein